MKEAIRFCDALALERPGSEGNRRSSTTLRSNNRSLWKRRSLLCHPERSRGICRSADLSWKCLFRQRFAHNVIPKACDFFDRFVFSAYPTTCISSFQPPDKAVILSGALRRSIANRALYARSRRTPAMLVGRCSCELSGRKLQAESVRRYAPSFGFQLISLRDLSSQTEGNVSQS